LRRGEVAQGYTLAGEVALGLSGRTWIRIVAATRLSVKVLYFLSNTSCHKEFRCQLTLLTLIAFGVAWSRDWTNKYVNYLNFKVKNVEGFLLSLVVPSNFFLQVFFIGIDEPELPGIDKGDQAMVEQSQDCGQEAGGQQEGERKSQCAVKIITLVV
jgi:hypothetical protein